MTGSIKAYTPNFNLIIPEFNITGWHDYLEEDFRSIDALFYNLFGINNFKGQWKNSTTYNIDDVVFVGNDTNYSGRLIKVLVQHTTAGTGNFTEFFTANPNYYELFADASTAQLYAQEARDWAVKLDGPVEDDLYSSKFYANIVNDLSTEITTLYNIRSDIQNVSLIGTEVVTVSNIKNSVQTVANNSTNITTVANNVANVNIVSDNISDVNSVNSNMTNINSVANNITNISTVASNVTNINTTATNIASINTNATNIDAINMNASNISVIQSASFNAQSALNSKNLAQDWAISENIVDNTDYSAKHYAEIASQYENPLRIGQIIQSTIPLEDAGLHLLDGSVIQGNGIYGDFYDHMYQKWQIYPQIFASEQNWQDHVATYGVCGKYVLDEVNKTIRLPLMTGFIEGTNDYDALGDLVEAGCPNIKAVFVNHARSYYTDSDKSITPVSGAIEVDSNSYPKSSFPNIGSSSGGGYQYDQTLKINASRSSPIYGNSTTVQPQAIKTLYYVCIATSVKTDIQVDIDEIATDLNGKADDNTVVHKTGNETILGEKTFQTYLLIKKSSDDFSITPQNPIYTEIRNTDVNDKEIGQFRVWKNTDGGNIIDLLGRYQDNSVNIYGASVGVKTYPNGDSCGYCDQNAPWAWGALVTLTSQNHSTNGYVQYSNGLIIQWGAASNSSVTFPKAFLTAGQVTGTCNYTKQTDYGRGYIYNLTKTGFEFRGVSDDMRPFHWIAVGY